MKPATALREFFEEHWVLSLATSDPSDPGAPPYSTPLFYALHWTYQEPYPDIPVLVFAGKETTTHGRHLGKGPTRVSAGIYLETEAVGKIKGVQLRGRVVQVSSFPRDIGRAFYKTYVTRHPLAAAMLAAAPAERLYALSLEWAKLTDNRFGFGVRKVLEFPVGEGSS